MNLRGDGKGGVVGGARGGLVATVPAGLGTVISGQEVAVLRAWPGRYAACHSGHGVGLVTMPLSFAAILP